MKKFFISSIILFSLSSFVFASQNFQQGVNAFNARNYSGASMSFFYALKEDPYDVNARYYYAMCYVRMGQKDKAISEFRTIIKMDGDSQAASMSRQALAVLDPENAGSSLNPGFISSNDVDNYINNAVNEKGLYIRWDANTPIKVYINASGISPEYVQEVKKAFGDWGAALKGSAQIVLVNNPQNANILCSFDSKSFEVTKTGYTLGTTKPKFSTDNKLQSVEIKLTTQNQSGKIHSPVEIYNTALHEIGHALGIWGHSQNKNDIMYGFSGSSTSRLALSPRDIRTVKMLYQNRASVTNTIQVNNIEKAASFNKNRMNSKIEEAQSYVKKNPYSANAHALLSETYLGLKYYDNAIASYKNVLSIDPKNANAYFKIGFAYEQKKNFNNASVFYKKAVSLKPAEVNYSLSLTRLYINYAKYNDAKATLSNLYKANPLTLFNPDVKKVQAYLDSKTK